MRQKSKSKKDPVEKTVRDIRRKTRRHRSSEEKIRVVLSGLRGEESIAELCRREGIAESLYYGGVSLMRTSLRISSECRVYAAS